MSSSSSSPCAACKLQRRKCTPECIFAPYFPADQPQKFLYVHRVFGASNVAKILSEIEVSRRQDAVESLVFEAQARLHDPVHGCMGLVAVLQNRLRLLMHEVTCAKKELTMCMGHPNDIAFLQASQAAAAAAFMQQPPQNLQHLIGNPSSSAVAQQYGAFPMMVVPQGHVPNAPLVIREPQAVGTVVQHHQQNVMTQQQLMDAQLATLLARNEQEEEMYRAFEQQQYRHQQLQQELRLSNRFDGVGPSMAAPAPPSGDSQNQIDIASESEPGPGPGPVSGLGPASVLPYLALGNYDGGYQNEQQQNENHPDNQQIATVPQPQLSFQRHHLFLVQEHMEQNQSLAVKTEEHKDPGGVVGFDVTINEKPH